eukprot:2487429-Pyramimonas_sp.AAC.1
MAEIVVAALWRAAGSPAIGGASDVQARAEQARGAPNHRSLRHPTFPHSGADSWRARRPPHRIRLETLRRLAG